MRVSPLAVVVGVVAAVSGWIVRGMLLGAGTELMPQPSTDTGVPATVDPEPPEGVINPPRHSTDTRGRRNLFAYATREAPAAPPAIFLPPPTTVVVLPAAPQVQLVEEQRSRLRFSYRYIGRFGPPGNPVAAFARDGEIVTARTGDRVDQHFVVRSIGAESVEVEASVDGELQTERVELGG